MKPKRKQQRGGGRKALQLCRQAQQALNLALADCEDSWLRELYVESVKPAPTDRRLMVSVSPMGDPRDPAELMQRIQFALPFLRDQVAANIHRKRVPELIFQVAPPEDDPSDESTGRSQT